MLSFLLFFLLTGFVVVLILHTVAKKTQLGLNPTTFVHNEDDDSDELALEELKVRANMAFLLGSIDRHCYDVVWKGIDLLGGHCNDVRCRYIEVTSEEASTSLKSQGD